MAAWIFEGGAWRGIDALPLTDRAWRLGMAVFETLWVQEGRVLFAEEHARSLAKAARELLDPALDGRRDFADGLAALVPGATGTLRLYWTAGDGAPADPVVSPRLLAYFERGAPFSGAVSAKLDARPLEPAFPGFKTANYWSHVAAQQRANRAGFDHALLRNMRGELWGAAFANVFFARGGELFTPSPATGARVGVVRGWVLGRIPCREVAVPAEDLDGAEEIFLTNSRVGIAPVVRLGGRALAEGPLTRRLRDVYLSGVRNAAGFPSRGGPGRI